MPKGKERARLRRCREACKNCAGCMGRNYERCYDDCRVCDMCTGTYSPQYASPYYTRAHRYGGGGYGRNPWWFGGLTSQGYYYNPASPKLSDCDSVCGEEVCREYRRQMRRYNDCLQRNSRRECNERYGCKNWRGFEYPNTPPRNPKYTNCQSCWRGGYTTFYSSY